MHHQRHVAHFVQEKGAAVAFLELADALAHRPCEGPFFVAEQLALQERFGDCRAVHGKVRLRRPIAVAVDRPRDPLFARPALPADKHVDALISDAADRLVDLLQGWTVSDQGVSGSLWSQRRGRRFPVGPRARMLLLIPMAWQITSRTLVTSNGLPK